METPPIYDNFGVRFQYPGNWKIADEQPNEWPRTVSVQSPTGGFWMLHVYQDQLDTTELIDEVMRTMGQEYEDLESHEATKCFGDVQAEGYDMNFYCLDMLVAAQARAFAVGDRTYLLLCQAEDQEFDRVAPIFDALTTSLINEMITG